MLPCSDEAAQDLGSTEWQPERFPYYIYKLLKLTGGPVSMERNRISVPWQHKS